MRRRILIMGAAGRDFHNFNLCFRDNKDYEVVVFTATQIPNITNRKYPGELSGKLYPDGIPIKDESLLPDLIKSEKIDDVIFSYSDVPHEYVMHRASLVNACGANFVLLGKKDTQLESKKPVIAVCAVRTGCGKSQTTRRIEKILKKMGRRVAVVRHPMPYGDLTKQIVQRFATLEDLNEHHCTIEEREEYEPHIMAGFTVFAGVDYEKILRTAEKEADVILWDGGNNDTPFFKPNLEVCVTDPHRVGHELTYYPGETNLLSANVIVINKVDTAKKSDVELLKKNIASHNKKAVVIEAKSPIFVEESAQIKGKRVLVVEDGPTLTHGSMKFGAGIVAAEKFGASKIVDPRPFLEGEIAKTFEHYPEIGTLLPAMGYGAKQIKDLEKVINKTDCDLVIIGTPINLRALLHINKPSVRVTYELEETTSPDLEEMVKRCLKDYPGRI